MGRREELRQRVRPLDCGSEPWLLCSSLIVGTRVNHDVCLYPDTGRTLHTDGKASRLQDAGGQLFKSGVFLSGATAA